MYYITLFPDATLQTGTQSDKRRVAPYATFGVLQSCTSFGEVVHAAATHTVSLNEYSTSDKCKPGQVHRHGSHFVKTKLIGLDVDDNLSIEQATAKLKERGYKYGLYTSFNHTAEKPKFRVILELAEPITNESTYRATWESLHRDFLGIDASCKDTARLYFHSNPVTRQVFIEDGGLVPVVHDVPAITVQRPRSSGSTDADGFESVTIRNKLPIEARNWLAGIDEYGEPWAPVKSERSSTFYKLALLCKERGYSREWCDEKLGARLRNDPSYLKDYGGSNGVDEKIHATLDQIFKKQSRHDQPEVYTASELSDARLYVSTWVDSHNLKVNRNGAFILPSGETRSLNRLLDSVRLDYERHVSEYQLSQARLDKEDQVKIKKINHLLLESGMREYVAKKREEHSRALELRVAYNGETELTELKKFVFALTGKEDPVVIAVLAHFIWQVKRKIFGIKVAYHLMPIITGPQGNGKSWNVRYGFLKPVDDFIATPTLTDLSDRRHFEAYMYNFVVFCDEMQNADQADVEGLKNFISAEKQTAREMYSTTIMEFKQNCTPIGCSNRSLATLIYDPTGMRRFFEIASDPDMPKKGWEIFNTIDYERLWRQVDESKPGKGYLEPIWNKLKVSQEELRMQDPVEIFLEESEAALSDGAEKKTIRCSDFYAHYRQFCNLNGHKTRQSNWFGMKLKEYGVEKIRTTIAEKRVWAYVVNSSYAPEDVI
jgi:hypothetical protein